MAEQEGTTEDRKNVFDVEILESGGNGKNRYCKDSTHTVDQDSWIQVGVLLVSIFNCGYILSYSSLMLVPLGWMWGSICMITVGAASLYGNCLLAEHHIIDGLRFIRYRDLMGYVFGRKAYYATYVLQFTNLILGNMGFMLLAAKALKEMNLAFAPEAMRTQVFVIITAVSFFIFSFMVPTISSMRPWLALSSILCTAYIVIVIALAIKDGKTKTTKNYDIPGDGSSRVFNALGAIAAITFCNNSGMLPEIQSTLRQPVVKNMKRALYMLFGLGSVVYYGLPVIGYWAYGSEVSDYLPKNLSGPVWAKFLANALMFLQSNMTQHPFVAPVHEALDTKFLVPNESMWSSTNLKYRLYLRASFYGFCAFIVALFPFVGDFVNLIGSLALLPLTLVFPSLLFLKVKGNTATCTIKTWHWTILIVSSLLSVATTIAAFRLIVENIRMYHFFANT